MVQNYVIQLDFMLLTLNLWVPSPKKIAPKNSVSHVLK
jgi:hypothetical protein